MRNPDPHAIGLLFGLLWLVIYMALLVLALAIDPQPESWPVYRVPAAGIAALILALLAIGWFGRGDPSDIG